MNKRFLVGALLVALSTAGYAFSYDNGDLNGASQVGKDVSNITKLEPETNDGIITRPIYVERKELNGKIDDINKNVNNLVTETNKNFDSVKTELNGLNDKFASKDELNGKADANNVYTKEEADNKFASKDELNGKVDKNTFNKNNTIIQSELDKVNQKADATDARIDGIVELNKDKNNKQDTAINNNKTEIENLKDKVNKENGANNIKNEVQDNRLDKLEQNKANKDDVENALAGKVDKNTFNKNNTIIQSELDKVNQKADATDARIDGIVELNKDKNNKQDTAINNNKTEIENLKDKVNKENGANNIKNEVQDSRLDKLEQNKANKDDVENALAGKVDKNTFNKNNTIIQSELDKVNQKADATDARIDGIVELNKDKNNKQNTAINNNKTEIENLKDKVNKENGANNIKNEVQDSRLDKLEQNKVNKADQEKVDSAQNTRLDTLENNYAQYDGRLSGLEKKVDHLDDKMNKGLSLMAAMNAVDFQNVQTGEMALGAGIGHYGNAQSVALGVAYAPVEDLTVNAKYSITAGDPDSFAVGAGATYKFKVGR